MPSYVGKGGHKLAFALDAFGLEVRGLVAADLGCNVGGFVDCLLQHGAARAYAVDTGYGTLEWKLRTDERVVTMERTNAMHVTLPEAVDVVTIDAGWTRQMAIVPHALELLRPGGAMVSLLKPQYEAERGQLRRGVLAGEHVVPVARRVIDEMLGAGLPVVAAARSPLPGGKGNVEFFLLLSKAL